MRTRNHPELEVNTGFKGFRQGSKRFIAIGDRVSYDFPQLLKPLPLSLYMPEPDSLEAARNQLKFDKQVERKAALEAKRAQLSDHHHNELTPLFPGCYIQRTSLDPEYNVRVHILATDELGLTFTQIMKLRDIFSAEFNIAFEHIAGYHYGDDTWEDCSNDLYLIYKLPEHLRS